MNRKVLLIGGGGTLGSYTGKELLKSGCAVDVICLEDNKDSDNCHYFKATSTYEFLKDFLNNRYYDAIVNFIHYTSVDEYKPVHMLLSSKTEHLIFLSSYRVYADLQHPITEEAPQLFDTVDDERFLNTEDYAVPKSKNEKFIREESNTHNWTIVRPVISFSSRRFDVVTENQIPDRTKKGMPIKLPLESKNLTAGLDWAGNSGKLIANLLFKEKALEEAFTISSAQNLKWSEVADYYTELIGAKFEWVRTEEYLGTRECSYILKYDRLFDRKIDNSKVLAVTGLTRNDFTSIKDGIKIELDILRKGK